MRRISKIKKHKLLLTLLAILVILIGVEAGFLVDIKKTQSLSSARPGKNEYELARAHWKAEIDRVGAAKAYEAFKKDTESKQYGVAHSLAHIFGELLYKKEGLKGIAVCDSSFAMGCFHSFFGSAIKEQGIPVVYTIDSECAARLGESGLQCAHGLGHGILSYLGDDKLNDALDICRKLTWKEPRGGCSSGVFMEFNFHTMQDPVLQIPRKLDPANPYYPCTSVPGFYKEACYFEQAQWYFSELQYDYAAIGNMCAGVENETGRVACYRGIGGILGPHVEFDTDLILKACKTMPDAASQIYCRQGAAWSFKGEPKAASRAKEPCIGMKGADLKSCMSGSIERGDKI